jgi:hypothetical protein
MPASIGVLTDEDRSKNVLSITAAAQRRIYTGLSRFWFSSSLYHPSVIAQNTGEGHFQGIY